MLGDKSSMKKRFFNLIGLSLASGMLWTSAEAQMADPEWPCIQVFVPEVMLAVQWPNFLEDSEMGLWKEDPTIASLARRLGEIDEFTDVERELIGEFAESIPEVDRSDVLNKLADGVVEVTNKRRSLFMKGIKKYTRQQISISKQLEEKLNLVAALEKKSDESSKKQLAELEENLHWHQRVYDQREQSIISLCERPVEIEEHLSGVMRELASYLP